MGSGTQPQQARRRLDDYGTRTLVVGALGVIGRNVVEHLADSGRSVVGLSRRQPPQAAHTGAEHVLADVTDAGTGSSSPTTPSLLSSHRIHHHFFATATRSSRPRFQAHQTPHTSVAPASHCAARTPSTVTSRDPTPTADDPPTGVYRPRYRCWARSPPPRAGCHQRHRSCRYGRTAMYPRHHRNPIQSPRQRQSRCPTPAPGHHWPPDASTTPHRPSPQPLPQPSQSRPGPPSTPAYSTIHRPAARHHTSCEHHREPGPPGLPDRPVTCPAVCPTPPTTR